MSSLFLLLSISTNIQLRPSPPPPYSFLFQLKFELLSFAKLRRPLHSPCRTLPVDLFYFHFYHWRPHTPMKPARFEHFQVSIQFHLYVVWEPNSSTNLDTHMLVPNLSVICEFRVILCRDFGVLDFERH